MTHPNILGPLNNLYQMQAQLLESATETDAAHQFHPELGSLNWLFGYSVYQELHWLREVLMGDNDLVKRVEHLFCPAELTLHEQCEHMPPRDHLLNWGSQIRDEHLMRLANPNTLAKHPMLENDRLQWFLLQEQAKHFETMLLVLNQRSLHNLNEVYQVKIPLTAGMPHWKTKEISQGHYRIGARNRPDAYDNELPPQAVELSSFRIALQPVSNSQYLAFMEAGGYANPDLWPEAGWTWQLTAQKSHPEYWQHDADGNWYSIGINGPSDLSPDEPAYGINQYEAQAYTNWVDSLGGEYAGAILQHEYQWELAARSSVIRKYWPGLGMVQQQLSYLPRVSAVPGRNHLVARFRSSTDHPEGRQPTYSKGIAPRQHATPGGCRNNDINSAGLRLVFPPRHRWS